MHQWSRAASSVAEAARGEFASSPRSSLTSGIPKGKGTQQRTSTFFCAHDCEAFGNLAVFYACRACRFEWSCRRLVLLLREYRVGHADRCDRPVAREPLRQKTDLRSFVAQ